jgi:hypothetical protein
MRCVVIIIDCGILNKKYVGVGTNLITLTPNFVKIGQRFQKPQGCNHTHTRSYRRILFPSKVEVNKVWLNEYEAHLQHSAKACQIERF